MKCPNDQTTLVMSERQGVEIDYCPTCRGVWLDRGELDKLIAGGGNTPPQQSVQHNNQPRRDDRDSHYSGDYDRGDRRHKKESFLGDLFDF